MKLAFAIALLLAGSALATTDIQCQPGGAHPCTYTITCLATNCAAPEVAEVNAAFDAAWRGDTIKLQAGRVFTSQSGFLRILQRTSGTSGYLTLTSTEDASLPDPTVGCPSGYAVPAGHPCTNVRITQHWLSKMPTIESNAVALTVQCTPPADHIKIRGIVFQGDAASNQKGGTLTLGCIGNTTGRKALSLADTPKDIIVEHCIFKNRNWLQDSAHMMGLNTGLAYIRNNWMAGSIRPLGETQMISIVTAPGPLHIFNNYIADISGQNIMTGGQGADYQLTPTGTIIANAFVNHPERLVGKLDHSPWTANTVVFTRRHVRVSGNGWFIAQNSGTTGTSPPNWPPTGNGTVNDNGITWKRTTAVTVSQDALGLKNLFECKTCEKFVIKDNQFKGFTNGFTTQTQPQAVIFKVSHYPPQRGVCGRCVPYMTGTVNVDGVDITSADGRPLPDPFLPSTEFRWNPQTIKIGGQMYTVADFVMTDPQRLRLTASAGTGKGVAYEWGDTFIRFEDSTQNTRCAPGPIGCIESKDLDMQFTNNIVDGAPMFLSIAQLNNTNAYSLGNTSIKNNLIRNMDCVNFGGCGGLEIDGFIYDTQNMPGHRIENNTVIDSAAGGNSFLASIEMDSGTRGNFDGRRSAIRGNFIVPKRSQGGNHDSFAIAGTTTNTDDGDPTAKKHLCWNSDCTVDEWGWNIFPGAAKAHFTNPSAGPNYTLCPGNVQCTPAETEYTSMFTDWTNRVLDIKPTSFAYHAMPDRSSIGVEYASLPLIRNPSTGAEGPRITTTTNTATFDYWVHGSIVSNSIGCSVEISTTQDMDSLITVDNPNTLTDVVYSRPGNTRSIRVSGLTANTTYWYRLHCGVAWEGSFATTTSGIACPSQLVTLSTSAIKVGMNSIVTVPAGWGMGTIVSSNSNLATIHKVPNRVGGVATAVSAGTVSITGTGWIASNGATGCALGARTITITAPTTELLVYDYNYSIQNRAPSRYVEGINGLNGKLTPLQPQPARAVFDRTQPINWAGGTYQVRSIVGCMHTNDQFRLNFNHWQGQQTGQSPAETNIPAATAGMNFNFTGSQITNTFAVAISTFDDANSVNPAAWIPWNWATPLDFMGVFSYPIETNAGLPANVTIISDAYPLDIRVMAVNVTSGATFSGWGNYTTNGFGERTYDCAFPTPVTISAPTNGATVSGVVTVTATASDNVGVTKGELLIDNITTFERAASPFTFSWDTSGLVSGSQHALIFRAYDAAGNSNSAGPITVTIQ